jgi:hypothetical protein
MAALEREPAALALERAAVQDAEHTRALHRILELHFSRVMFWALSQ